MKPLRLILILRDTLDRLTVLDMVEFNDKKPSTAVDRTSSLDCSLWICALGVFLA